MKKTVSMMLCLLLIFSSVNFAFADFNTTDQANLQSIKNSVTSGGQLYSVCNQIKNSLISGGALYNLLNNVNSNAYSACDLLNQILQALPSSVDYTQYLSRITSALTYTGDGTGSFVADIYLTTDAARATLANIRSDLINYNNNLHDLSGTALGTAEFFSPLGTMQPWSFSYYSSDDLHARYARAFSQTLARIYAAQHQGLGSNMGSFNLYSQYANPFSVNYVSTDDILIKSFSNLSQTLGTITSGYLNTTKIVNWKTLAETSPTSTGVSSMLENYLEAIQNPIARLAYVHASDEEIAAREKAAANQTAVVNNFIDSNGSGAAPASSFGSVASMSSGYTTNMNTDAQASGIWNIFNSNNFGWFSQETANQLDTTVSTRKRSSDFETPLLDQQIAEIYKELGVDVND